MGTRSRRKVWASARVRKAKNGEIEVGTGDVTMTGQRKGGGDQGRDRAITIGNADIDTDIVQGPGIGSMSEAETVETMTDTDGAGTVTSAPEAARDIVDVTEVDQDRPTMTDAIAGTPNEQAASRASDSRNNTRPIQSYKHQIMIAILQIPPHQRTLSPRGADSPTNPDIRLATCIRRVLHEILIQLDFTFGVQHDDRTASVQKCSQTLATLDCRSCLYTSVVSDAAHQHSTYGDHSYWRAGWSAFDDHH